MSHLIWTQLGLFILASLDIFMPRSMLSDMTPQLLLCFFCENSHKTLEHEFLKVKISSLLKDIVQLIVSILGHQTGIEWLSSGCPGQSECCVASSPGCWYASPILVLQQFKWLCLHQHLGLYFYLKTQTLITNLVIISDWHEDSQR